MTRRYSSSTQNALELAVEEHRLPSDFTSTVDHYYWPVAEHFVSAKVSGSPLLIGIQGSQGSGKSTFAAFLKMLLEYEFRLSTLVMSIDDFYLTRAERIRLSEQVHPLFLTRGVPGTHDIELLRQVFELARNQTNFDVPVFDKAVDDRADKRDWQKVDGPLDVVILEGWCVGVSSQAPSELDKPLNELERLQDLDGRWRCSVNEALAGPYRELFVQLDQLVALQAPSFECVYGWRLLQEQKLADRLRQQGKSMERTMSPAELKQFISHYQRLTEHALRTMPDRAHCLLQLREDHSFARLIFKQE